MAIPGVAGSNALVADKSDGDKFVMGLLRAFADVVLIASGTLRASPKGRWRPDGVYPKAASAFAELRAAFDNTQLVDLLYAIANYNGVVRILAALQVDLEDEYRGYFEKFPFAA